MSDDNFLTEAKDEALSIALDALGGMKKMFENKNPYNQEPAKKQDIINGYLSLSPQRSIEMIDKHGGDTQDVFQEIESEIDNGFI